ncbi:MAG TPA: TRAP transporter large permease [Hyphomicrobiaceae bacterium]|jgi:tripartite ATP-independent transporter DctM subunit|nr:TRAP transporter large permease [Hyphomicrobiaceae bacterium]
MSEQTLVATVGCVAVLVLMLIRVPIAVSLGAVAVAGFAYLVGPGPAVGILIDSPIRTVTNFNFSVIPMFILMGAFVSASGMSRELFRAANAWVGHLPGGTAIATIFACGGFAAINGSSIASAATMTQVALPEMRRVGYDPGLSAGVVAAGGTLGIMIPPSVMFILYSILTDTNLAALFIAGILPGLIAIALYCATVLILYRVRREWMPRTASADWHERWQSLRDVWATLLLFGLVVGGIYGGVVTIAEAAGLGAFGALAIGVMRRRLSWEKIVDSLVEALRTSAAIFFIVIAAFLFQYFLAVTQMSQLLSGFLTSLPVGPLGVVIVILAFYIIIGMFVDELAIILLTIPIVFPIVTGLGFDPVWFGVLVVVTVQIGLIAPPVGIICFIMNNMVPDIGLVNIYKGAMPFVIADLFWLALLVAFPTLSLLLPQLMG